MVGTQGRLTSLLVLFSALFISVLARQNHDLVGFRVLSIQPLNQTEGALLRESFPDMDVLSHLGTLTPDHPADVVLSPADFRRLTQQFPTLAYKTKVSDLAVHLRKHAEDISQAEDRWNPSGHLRTRDVTRVDETTSFFDNYRSFDHIKQYLSGLRARFGDLIVPQKIGESVERKEIMVYVLTNPNSTETKRQVIFNGGQHAREWLAMSSVLYSMTQLLVGHATDPHSLLNKIEFHFVPVVNPDGYEYSRNTYRMWRKNRRPVGNTYGVDLNRNWPKGYGSGSSSNPHSEIYRGAHAFSEPETKALSDYIRTKAFRAHVDFHTYGRDILRRWASSDARSPDDAVMKEAGDAARDNIIHATQNQGASGIRYASERGSFLGLDGGCMPDWTYSELGMVSYTVELSEGDFVLPPSYIRPTGLEAHTVITTLADFTIRGKFDANNMHWIPGSTRK